MANDGGFFSRLLDAESTNASESTWSCHCGGCAELAGPGEGGATPGGYATTPTEGAYRYVSQAQSPALGAEGQVAALMAGSKWASVDAGSAKTIITFSFADPATSTFAYGKGNDFQATLSRFSNADVQLTRDMLARIEAVCNVRFVEVQDNAGECGVLRYGYSEQPNAMNYAGYAFYPSSAAIGGDIWIGANQAGAQWDFYRPNLVLHETLHALGLKHPFSAGAVLAAEQDIIPNTVMSYSAVAGSSSGTMSVYPSEPMALDIAALQHLYGASNLNAADTVYDLAAREYQGGFRAIWDASGTDVFDASKLGHGVSLDLQAGARSDIGAAVMASGNVGGSAVSTRYTSTLSIASGAVIENAVGSEHADVIAGNSAANRLWGGGGDDRLDGRDGDDILTGGSGNDVLNGGAGRDTACFGGNRADHAIARSGTSLTVIGDGTDTLTSIERLSFNDCSLAFDIDGHAGQVAKVLGAVFGAPLVGNAGVMGVCLGLLDNGMGYQDLMQLALNVRLGAAAGNAAVADLLAPSLGESRESVLNMLDSGSYSQAVLGQMAADSSINAGRIGLVGLADSGIAYIA